MAAAFRISFMEFLLLKGIADSDETFEDDGKMWTWVSSTGKFTGQKNIERALTLAVENGLVELNDSGMKNRSVRMTRIGEQILKAGSK